MRTSALALAADPATASLHRAAAMPLESPDFPYNQHPITVNLAKEEGPMSDESVSGVPLVEVIDALRADLKAAQEKSDPDHPLIIEEIEVELQVVVTKGVNGSVGAKIEVLNIGKLLGLGQLAGDLEAKGSWAKVATQKLKLKLSAGDRNPKTGKITKATVSDEADFE